MTRLERDEVCLKYRYESLLALSKRVSEGHLRRDTARNLLPYVEKLILICSKLIECEKIKDRIEKADHFFNQAYDIIRVKDAIPVEEVDESDAQARASVETLKRSVAEKKLEVDAIRIRIAKEPEILNYLEILDLNDNALYQIYERKRNHD
jgi:hypothetical protein